MAYRNNHLQTAGESATPEELRKFTQLALKVFSIEAPDLHNPDDVKRAIVDYFNYCDVNGIRPGNMGLYAALGMSKQDVHDAITGKTKYKVSPAALDLIQKARHAMSAYREGLALEGRINPVTYIFMGKNFDGLQDQTHIEVTAAPGPAANLSPDQIAKQIEQDIPLEAEYKETSD